VTRSLTGQVVFTTGAARGIGEHTARVAAQRGARVALVGLEPQRLAALRAEPGPDHAWFERDVTDQPSLDKAARDAVARLELAHRGVGVGTAHPSWIDTDVVRDAKNDLSGFREALDRLPWPLRSTTAVEACAAAFVDGIERRKRRGYVPRAIRGVRALRGLLTGPLSEFVIGRTARTSVPRLEAEVRALGRTFGQTTAYGSHGAGGRSGVTG
jgi:NAD(P)-dependent dehydrogenase (short-subunit alcohol dehydrogenase family)